MKEEILDFIHRRFPEDCHWTDGNCAWFAIILQIRFDLKIYYLPIRGHFVCKDEEGNFYDWTGLVVPEEEPQEMKQLIRKDIQWYKRLVKDCLE